ncbi:MAG: 50S ribosomal protein L30 [Candidatus Aenigmatarchaeota archaeon]|nr:MAG: 50S ribosomal protein L30 [Candidatus Aenigmarchaeota archaeon]
MYAVVRIRGRVGVRREVEDTLRMLRLKRVNNCVLVPENPSFKGMLEKAKDYITWGEINKETLVALLRKRLRLKGDKRVDEKILKEVTDFNSFEEFADALLEGKIRLKDFERLNPVFRLTPPSKGFKSVKQHWPKGDLGYRGEAINELLERMI